MHMVNLVYASRTVDIDDTVIRDILDSARRNNEKCGVTGALHFSSKFFLQCLEGPRSAVNDVYRRIMQDKRHHEPVILTYHPIDERRFSRWSMAYVGEATANRHLFFKYSGKDDFNPFDMTGSSAELLLGELTKSCQT